MFIYPRNVLIVHDDVWELNCHVNLTQTLNVFSKSLWEIKVDQFINMIEVHVVYKDNS